MALWVAGFDLLYSLFDLDVEKWRTEAESIAEYFSGFDRLPPELAQQLDALHGRLDSAAGAPVPA